MFLLENNSKRLQSALVTAQQAVYSLKKIQVRVKEIRSTKEFQRLYDQSIKLADLRNENELQKWKRQKQAPRRLFDIFQYLFEFNIMRKTKWTFRICCEAVDSVVEALQMRFRQEDSII